MEENKPQIYLISVQANFFQRIGFKDVIDVQAWIESNTTITKDFNVKISLNGYLPPLSPNAMEELKIIRETNISLSIDSHRICINLDGVYQPEYYNKALESFIFACKQILPLITTEPNLCGGMEINNNSFLITDKPVETINKRYIYDNELRGASRAAIIYDNETNVADYKTQIMNAIKTDTINIFPPMTGVNLIKSLAMIHQQLSVPRLGLESYLSQSLQILNFNSMSSLVFNNNCDYE